MRLVRDEPLTEDELLMEEVEPVSDADGPIQDEPEEAEIDSDEPDGPMPVTDTCWSCYSIPEPNSSPHLTRSFMAASR